MYFVTDCKKLFTFCFCFNILIISRLQKTFDNVKKSFINNFIFNKLTFIIVNKTIIVIVFRLHNYLQVKHNFYKTKIFEIIKQFIQLITINKFRFIVVKNIVIEKNTYNNVFSLLFYLIEQECSRIIFQKIIFE